MASGLTAGTNDRYKWVALTNTTAAMFMSALDSRHSSDNIRDVR